MDRKAWIILVLCGLGLVANTYFMGSNEKELREQDRKESVENSVGDSTKSELVSQRAELPEAKEDQPHQLIGKDGDVVDVIYTFTNFGGGVKTAEFPREKAVYGDGHIKLNALSSYPVGAIADDYQTIDSTFYEIVAKDDKSITYKGKLASGLVVTKKWTLKQGDTKGYQLSLDISIKNESAGSVNLAGYGVYTGTAAPLHGKEMQDKAGWFYYQDGEFEFDKEGPFKDAMFGFSRAKAVEVIKPSSLEYAGVNNQFFTTFFLPKFQADSIWATGRERDIQEDEEMIKRWVFTMGVNFPHQVLNVGSEQNYSLDVYMGPREREVIKAVADNTDAIMNYGWFSWFANIMNWALTGIHSWFGDASWAWGVSVVLLTVFIRIIIWPLHNKSTRTMKRMGKLQPLMKELREKYADNPQKLNQETMKLYKTYGVNPMGGCLPMLIQIPIFFGVFKMLGAAVEMRGASFLWVEDLSRPDTLWEPFGVPINVLPIVMAVTMVLQMQLTPQSGDKLQRRIFMLMPLMFFFFCYNYAAALALYWSTQNIVSIGQTLLMKNLPEPELEEKKGGNDGKPRKKGMFEKLAERMEEVQRQQEIAAGRKPGGNTQQPANPFGGPGDMKQAKKPKKRTPKTGG